MWARSPPEPSAARHGAAWGSPDAAAAARSSARPIFGSLELGVDGMAARLELAERALLGLARLLELRPLRLELLGDLREIRERRRGRCALS